MSKPDEQHEPQPKPYAPKPRFLAASGRWDPVQAKRDQKLREAGEPIPDSEEDHGYTDLPGLALPHEPECLDEDDWDRHVGKEVDQRAKARHIERERSAKLLSQEERIVKAVQEAAVKRRDVRREVWLLRQMQARKCKPEKLEQRVQGLERITYLGRAA